MKNVILLKIIFSVLIFAQNSKDLHLISDEREPEYLGCLTCSKTLPESICNKSGPYGSTIGVYSIWNSVGLYGSSVGLSSPWNTVSIEPPKIVNSKGIFTATFTINTIDPYKDPAITAFLRKSYFKHDGNLVFVREDFCALIESLPKQY